MYVKGNNMDLKKATSKTLAIALFLGLMTNLGGCTAPTGNGEGGEEDEGVNTEQPANEAEEDEGGEGGEGGEG
jgi:hypothetical protein